ncbi:MULTISPECIES: GDSL-type esterase/lipase family protein [Spirosoma]|uniref:GDSL-type esterase/lipase family protein n=1 Tax=Spirosoma liriopis TaxID=2937440 RepID=A0ABT0HGZ0_9BACT|nr:MULTISPECIES: GDSL-type esterase/lipase family protein [Spirosoma]MCK8491260.1 GDSL-type esterase/lipase family protein [Spirosoma liriopis]UHG90634.1 GDSL-type esterase/lipase family protein [Spirosoma oryzicola]
MIWYEDEVRQLETKIKSNLSTSDRVVFYGSSSIRLWSTLAQDFPDITALNLGFGGSTLAACAWFFERLVVPANPRCIVFYAGDNDLGDNRHPEEVYLFFCALAEKVRRQLPDTQFYYLSIKLSPARWDIADKIRATNKLIADKINELPNFKTIDMTTALLGTDGKPRREFFQADGLHLTPAGYQVWKQVLQQLQIFNNLFTY